MNKWFFTFLLLFIAQAFLFEEEKDELVQQELVQEKGVDRAAEINLKGKKSALVASELKKSALTFVDIGRHIEQGDLVEIADYLQSGGDIETSDEAGRSLLNQAFYYGQIDLAQWLIDRGADVSSRDSYGKGVIHYSTATGDASMVRYLLQSHQLDANAKDQLGQMPLHIAIQRGQSDLFDVLVEYGAEVAPVFHSAIFEGEAPLLEKMIEIDPSLVHRLDHQGNSSLLLATLEGQVEIVDLLRQHGAVSEL